MGNKKAGFRTDIMANLESEMKSRYEVIDFLSFRSMQYNYAELIKTRTKEKTSEAMSALYETLWEKAKNDVIFWYENDFVRDDDGEIIFGAMGWRYLRPSSLTEALPRLTADSPTINLRMKLSTTQTELQKTASDGTR